MARTVTEWVGKTDDTPPSKSCMLRILARQDHCCALSGRPFTAKEKPEFDHKVPLWLGGKNTESNLHAIHRDQHKEKTASEATVRAKMNAQAAKNFGLKTKVKQKIPSPPKPARVEKPKLPPRQLYGATS